MGSVELFVVVDVCAGDMQDVIGVAGHEVAADDRRMRGHRFLERVEDTFFLAGEGDLDEHRRRLAEEPPIDQGPVAVDDARLLERSDSAKAGRGRQSDTVGQIDVRQATIGLELFEDGLIDGIRLVHTSIMRDRASTRNKSAESTPLTSIFAIVRRVQFTTVIS